MAKLDFSVTVLVVDDMLSMRHIVKRALIEIGFKDFHNRSVASDPAIQSFPVLMITAEAKMEAVQMGAPDYLVKPISTQALQEKLEKMFQKSSKGKI